MTSLQLRYEGNIVKTKAAPLTRGRLYEFADTQRHCI